MGLLYGDLTRRIINAYYKAYNHLGYGFLEKVYQNALYFELISQGLECKAQHKIDVYYYDKKVGEYYADIIVNNCIVLELKAAESLCEEHECQLQNYLKATYIEVGLLFNFGKKPEYRRKIFMNK
jgi:GxxExxY protein